MDVSKTGRRLRIQYNDNTTEVTREGEYLLNTKNWVGRVQYIVEDGRENE